MDVEALRKTRRRYPFQAYWLRLNDGRRFLIDKPYYLDVSPVGNLIGVATGREHVEFLSPDSVKEVAFVSETEAAK
jgi:hypothetical protein